jgi:hypothetical protein
VQFRSEIDTLRDYQDTPFFLEVELLFADIVAAGSAEKALSLFMNVCIDSLIPRKPSLSVSVPSASESLRCAI